MLGPGKNAKTAKMGVAEAAWRLVNGEPEDIEEGTFGLFPSGLPHYVTTNRTNVRRMILSANIG